MKIKQTILVLVLLSILRSLPGYSQQVLTGNEVLAGARNDVSYLMQQQHTAFAQGQNARIPFVEQMSIRTETDRFLLQRQEYLTRVSVNGFAEMRRQRQLHNSELALVQTDERIVLHEALAERYQAMISYFCIQQEIALQEKLLENFQDKLTVLNKMAVLNSDPDIEEVVKTEYEIDGTTLRLKELRNREQQLINYIGLSAGRSGSGWQFDTSSFIPPLRLSAVLNDLNPNPENQPELVQKSANAALKESEISLEKARSRQMLDFAQVRYADQPKEGINGDLSLSIGLTLPYKGSSRAKLATLKIEENESLTAVALLRNELNRDIADAEAELSALTARYLLAGEQISDAQNWLTPEKNAMMATEGPLPVLRHRELLLRRQLRQIETVQDMYANYLEVLDLSGILSAQPLQNYLNAGLSTY